MGSCRRRRHHFQHTVGLIHSSYINLILAKKKKKLHTQITRLRQQQQSQKFFFSFQGLKGNLSHKFF